VSFCVLSAVGGVVGDIVGVSEAARVGVGGGGVIVNWFMVEFSVVSREEEKKSPFWGDMNGKSTRACRSGQASNVKIRILMASNSTKLNGLIRMLRLVLFLRFGERLVSSDTSELDVIRTVLQE
jgi:hypothetical protein